MDNHHFAGSKENPNMRISSQMIVERLKGQDAIVAALHSNIKTGIEGSDQDLSDRRRIYGPNSFPPPVIKSIMELILENFEDPINKILLAAALVSLVIGLYKEGFPSRSDRRYIHRYRTCHHLHSDLTQQLVLREETC